MSVDVSAHNVQSTKVACYTGYAVQAIVNNLAPLLFVVFNDQYHLPVAQLGILASLNFGVQLATDFSAMFFVDRLGYRRPMVAAHLFAAIGLVMLGILPGMLGDPFVGLCIAVSVYAVGGGLLEVIVSPVVENLPTPADQKATGMALLHSFYCWGQVGVVVVTTTLLAVFGSDHWQILPVMWALVPLVNMVVFTKVFVPDTVAEEDQVSILTLLGTPLFLAALVMMMTGGAAELLMSQWSSFFAQHGTGVPKPVGDLLGPGLFAVLMGLGRMAYGLWGNRWDLRRLLIASSLGAAACYIITAVSSVAIISLLACALCGMMVSLLWPGTFSLTSARFPLGGAAMFAILALAGDTGGAVGPGLAGGLATWAQESGGFLGTLAAWLPADGGSGLRTALLLCTVIPVVFAFTVWRIGRNSAAQ